jgi:hypothetical protein
VHEVEANAEHRAPRIDEDGGLSEIRGEQIVGPQDGTMFALPARLVNA